jgi:hypothetical protein
MKKRVQPVEMAKDTLIALRRLFRPSYNQELVELLGEEQHNVWVEDTIRFKEEAKCSSR